MEALLEKLKSDWCTHKHPEDAGVIFADDYACACGIEKHHYHSKICGLVVQVG